MMSRDKFLGVGTLCAFVLTPVRFCANRELNKEITKNPDSTRTFLKTFWQTWVVTFLL